MGTNLWYGVNLAVENPERLARELAQLAQLGVTNIRVLATTQGPDNEPWRVKPAMEQWNPQTNTTILNEDYLKGLDLLLSEASKHDMTVVIMLNNFWYWSGGLAQYVKWYSEKADDIPYPEGPLDEEGIKKYKEYTETFYSCKKCKEHFSEVAMHIINRKNTLTGVLYKEDPTIMAWQLANEPFSVNLAKEATEWINATCYKIKEVDKNHMVSIGNAGNYEANYNEAIALNCIDYGTFHLWPQDAGWYNPKRDNETYESTIEKTKAYIVSNIEGTHKMLQDLEEKTGQPMDKPLVFEGFALARDNEEFFQENTTERRDDYYNTIFNNIAEYEANNWLSGVSFWAWAGEGRPSRVHRIWEKGDEWIGDPPHANQGWYSVYDNDTTITTIKSYAKRVNRQYTIDDHELKLDFWLFISVPILLVIGGITLDWILRKPDEEEAESLIVRAI